MSYDDVAAVASALSAALGPAVQETTRRRYNVGPGDRALIVAGSGSARRMELATWGFRRGEGGLLINARSETVATRPRFREAFVRGRCVAVTDGFYEWSGPRGQRIPHHIRPDRGLLLLAGLVERDDAGELRFTVLTTQATEQLAPLHPRMPAILRGQDRLRAWLDGASPAAAELLDAVEPGPLQVRPASRRVNSGHEGPECLTPDSTDTPPDSSSAGGSADGQMGLFGRPDGR